MYMHNFVVGLSILQQMYIPHIILSNLYSQPHTSCLLKALLGLIEK